jgi:hypothetical protein
MNNNESTENKQDLTKYLNHYKLLMVTIYIKVERKNVSKEYKFIRLYSHQRISSRVRAVNYRAIIRGRKQR